MFSNVGMWQWIIILAIVLIIFGGRGKISSIMADLGKGLKAFKNNVKDEDVTNSKVEASQEKLEPRERTHEKTQGAGPKQEASTKDKVEH